MTAGSSARGPRGVHCVADAHRGVLYNPGQRRVRRAPDVAFEEAVKRATGVRRADVRDLLPTPAVA